MKLSNFQVVNNPFTRYLKKRILLGIMYVTAFVSMWISNTAATSIMLPIGVSLGKQLIKYNETFNNEQNKNRVKGKF